MGYYRYSYYGGYSCYYQPPMKSYEFSALTKESLCVDKLKYGATFKMPECATTTITVKDNDPYLSGDSCWNENSNDWYGQKASIEGHEGEEGNGGQIYAEKYWILQGSDGKKYYMIEIEQEGSNDDYFTFYGDVPPACVELTVKGACNVTSNWINFNHLGAGEVGEPVSAEDCLPESGVGTMTIVVDFAGGPDGFFTDAIINGTGDERYDGITFDNAYCVAFFDPLNFNQSIDVSFILSDENVSTDIVANPQNLDVVNWILNEADELQAEGYTQGEIQGAIWALTDTGRDALDITSASYDDTMVINGFGEEADALEIFDRAIVEGEGYEAGAGDITGVILVPTEDSVAQGNIQPFIIGVECEDTKKLCVCDEAIV